MSKRRTKPTTLGPTRSRRLVRDLVAAEHDLIELARRHSLSPDDLAEWVAHPDHQQTLAGLCMLADMQTQILLSRYRLLAAGRLIRLATAEQDSDGASVNKDTARRACVDLLKIDLKRVGSLDPPSPPPNTTTLDDWPDIDPDPLADPNLDFWPQTPIASPPDTPETPNTPDFPNTSDSMPSTSISTDTALNATSAPTSSQTPPTTERLPKHVAQAMALRRWLYSSS